ncbi:tRNA-uridine aminocarboxypropyltransferase [Alteromonas sp. CYL-A6]|uniref:tRNA-uridine aminocarboxypropyltransferase n=1 Tax=Alteromonas nitratireducens TaxID=3390813 RepID=UPI0034B9A78C
MRRYCSHCEYPLSTCVCDAVLPQHSPIDIVVIQHPKEQQHAKNTARLLPLALPQAHLIASDDSETLAEFAGQLTAGNSVLIYPSDDSRPIESVSHETSRQLTHLVLIDGSWRQAYAIFQQHPWLAALPGYHFTTAPSSQYSIRHTARDDSLSTLEAVAYSLEQLFSVDTAPLIQLQNAMIKNWQGPAAHRR